MNCYHLLAAVAALLTIEPVLAVEMPCPVPGLEEVVDTLVKCNCFYSLAGSGLDLGDSSTFGKVFADDYVQNFSQTGQYVGSEGIAEYLSYVKGGNWVQDYILIGTPIFLDMTGSTMDQCVATIAERRRTPFNPAFSHDNQDLCVDVVAGSTLYYTMTGNQAAPVAIQEVNAWLPDEFLSGANPYFVDTPATVEYVCDVIVNSCGKELKSSKDGCIKIVAFVFFLFFLHILKLNV
jgi:O-acetyl-ADP-ribose deacetylase (regulator of RNase III)